jgi:type I restriction enzyme S subunit
LQDLTASLELNLFLDLFGSPATNPKGWDQAQIGDLAEIFSDGPFGSNLKSSHYTESGVRVIRLQNIGVREFVDNDKAFVSNSHYEELSKHTCLPGDVLIGTLGDPNLRACIQPHHIPIAINNGVPLISWTAIRGSQR